MEEIKAEKVQMKQSQLKIDFALFLWLYAS